MTQTSSEFWEQHYFNMTKPSGGRPSAALVRFTEERGIGRSLDLGCARGDDAIWLAQQGWTAIGVDVAEAALVAARKAAEIANVTAQAHFECHDLSESFPEGQFDLVSAMFLHSPTQFARIKALKRAAEAVSSGGLLLIVAHGSRAPWSWSDENTVFPTAREELDELGLTHADWNEIFVGPTRREANGPDNQVAEVIDTIIALEKR